MNKKSILWILLDLVFLVVFNIVFFVAADTQRPVSVWISYGFIHFAYISLLITSFLTRRKSSSISVARYSICSVSLMYFLIVLIAGIIFIIVHPNPYKVSLIVHMIILGIYIIILIYNIIANQHTEYSIKKHNVELQYIKQSTNMLKNIIETTDSKELKKKIEKVYDLLHSSQVKSDSSVYNYELAVIDLINILHKNINENDAISAEATIEKIIINAKERNRKLKY